MMSTKEITVIETPLIGSGSQEEADNRVRILLDMGTSRGYLTYEELNEKLPDEVVSPDKLDSLLMMIDEMGIKLIDEQDIAEHQKPSRSRADKPAEKPEKPISVKSVTGKPSKPRPVNEEIIVDEDDDEIIDLNLEAELAEASTKR